MNRRTYINNPDKLCYIFGKVTLLNQKSNITPFIKKTYKEYFRIGDQKNYLHRIFVVKLYC